MSSKNTPKYTLGYRISAHYKRVTIWYFNSDKELSHTDVFIPNPDCNKLEREIRIKRRIQSAKEHL